MNALALVNHAGVGPKLKENGLFIFTETNSTLHCAIVHREGEMQKISIDLSPEVVGADKLKGGGAWEKTSAAGTWRGIGDGKAQTADKSWSSFWKGSDAPVKEVSQLISRGRATTDGVF